MDFGQTLCCYSISRGDAPGYGEKWPSAKRHLRFLRKRAPSKSVSEARDESRLRFAPRVSSDQKLNFDQRLVPMSVVTVVIVALFDIHGQHLAFVFDVDPHIMLFGMMQRFDQLFVNQFKL